MKPKEKELKDRIKENLGALLGESEEPPPWKLQALKLAIGFLAVEAKLEEAEYGGFFSNGSDPDGVQESAREEPTTRRPKRRKRTEPDDGLDFDPGTSLSQ